MVKVMRSRRCVASLDAPARMHASPDFLHPGGQAHKHGDQFIRAGSCRWSAGAPSRLPPLPPLQADTKGLLLSKAKHAPVRQKFCPVLPENDQKPTIDCNMSTEECRPSKTDAGCT